MSKTHVFTAVLSVCALLTAAHADISADLERAKKLRSDGDTAAAESLLNQIIIQSASPDHTLAAKAELAAVLIATGRTTQARTMRTQIQTDFAADPNLPQALTTVAHAHRDAKSLRKARDLYRTVADKYPKSPPAIWCRMRDAIMNIRLRSYPAALEARTRLQADFAADEGYPIALCLIADTYRKQSRYKEALPLYQKVLENHPKARHAFWSRMGRALSNIGISDYTKAIVDTAKICTDYPEDDRIPYALCKIAEAFQYKCRHEDAIPIFQQILAEHPDSKQAFWAQLRLAQSHIETDDEPAAKAALHRLTTDFVDDKDLPSNLCKTAELYQSRNKDNRAIDLFKQILDRYPDSPTAIHAQAGLTVSHIRMGDDPNAMAATDRLRTDFVADKRLPAVLDAITHEAFPRGKKSLSIELYNWIRQNCPDSSYAPWAEMWLTVIITREGNESAAIAGAERLLIDYTTDEALPEAINAIARNARSYVSTAASDRIYTMASEQISAHPSARDNIWTRTALLVCRIGLDPQTPPTVVQSLMSEFPNDPALPKVVFRIAETFRAEAYYYERHDASDLAQSLYKSATDVWQTLIAAFPESELACEAAIRAGQLLPPEQAVDRFAWAAETFPDSKFADESLYYLARTTHVLCAGGAMPPPQAAEQIRFACNTILRSYPRSPHCRHARKILEQWASYRPQEEGGAK